MTELEYTVDIARPIEEVFELIADPRNDRRWCPRVGECQQVAGDEPSVGARYELEHHPTFQRPHKRSIEIVELLRPTRVVSVQEDAVARFTISYTLRAAASGTSLTQRDEITWRINSLTRLIGKRIIRKHIGEQLSTLKTLLEKTTTPDDGNAY